MKVQAIKEIWTASPEKKWSTGEVMDLPEKIARQLLTNPNFREVKEASEKEVSVSLKRKRK